MSPQPGNGHVSAAQGTKSTSCLSLLPRAGGSKGPFLLFEVMETSSSILHCSQRSLPGAVGLSHVLVPGCQELRPARISAHVPPQAAGGDGSWQGRAARGCGQALAGAAGSGGSSPCTPRRCPGTARSELHMLEEMSFIHLQPPLAAAQAQAGAGISGCGTASLQLSFPSLQLRGAGAALPEPPWDSSVPCSIPQSQNVTGAWHMPSVTLCQTCTGPCLHARPLPSDSAAHPSA